MNKVFLSALLAVSAPAFAAVGDISCLAKQFEVAREGLKNQVEKPLTVERHDGTALILTADIGERAFVLSGDTKSGDFLLTQAWGQDYTSGINTAASFDSRGRMTISMVEGAKVFRLECVKTLASDFPRE